MLFMIWIKNFIVLPFDTNVSKLYYLLPLVPFAWWRAWTNAEKTTQHRQPYLWVTLDRSFVRWGKPTKTAYRYDTNARSGIYRETQSHSLTPRSHFLSSWSNRVFFLQLLSMSPASFLLHYVIQERGRTATLTQPLFCIYHLFIAIGMRLNFFFVFEQNKTIISK